MSERPRIVVFAYSEVGYRCTKALLESKANVRAIFTYEDDPNEEVWFSSVKSLALEYNIPYFTPEGVSDGASIELIRSLKPEILFSFYYRHLIPKEVLSIPQLGAFNMHGSLLPKYRGRACVNWAIINGEKETGATLHYMTEKPDKGDIVDQERVPIEYTDTALDVMLKVAEAAKEIITRALPLIEKGIAPRRSQDPSLATYFGRRRPEDGIIKWEKDAIQIYNLVRAVTHPYPGAFTFYKGRKIFVWKASVLNEDSKEVPGTVLSTAPFEVATGRGKIRIERCQEEGKEELDGAEWARANVKVNDTFCD